MYLMRATSYDRENLRQKIFKHAWWTDYEGGRSLTEYLGTLDELDPDRTMKQEFPLSREGEWQYFGLFIRMLEQEKGHSYEGSLYNETIRIWGIPFSSNSFCTYTVSIINCIHIAIDPSHSRATKSLRKCGDSGTLSLHFPVPPCPPIFLVWTGTGPTIFPIFSTKSSSRRVLLFINMLSSSEFDDADQVREGVFDRRLHLCPRLQSFDTNDLVLSCSKCNQFLLYCCHCSKKFPTRRKGKPCHHYRLVFTDGACRNNGQVGATAGIGIAHGRDEESQLSIPITTEVDSYSRRTSQRAELIAAIEGLSTVCQYDYDLPDHDDPDDSDKIALIVATDSEYVVKGMTEWLPQWKVSDIPTF